MASVTVTLPDDQAERIVTAFAARHGVVPATMQDGMTIVQDAVFAWLRDQTLLFEANAAREAVLSNANDPLVNAMVTQG